MTALDFTQAAVDAAMKAMACIVMPEGDDHYRAHCYNHRAPLNDRRECELARSVAAAVVAAVQGPIKAEALREAAAGIAPDHHHCFRPQGCVNCGRQRARSAFRIWLHERADRIEAQ